ncbi:MAG: hypothetical protein QM791_18940 [Ferruginibacter sp.]
MNTGGLYKDAIALPYWSTADLNINQFYTARKDSLWKAYKNSKNYKLLSDWAWISIKTGDVKDAIPVLDSLYNKYPSDYNIVANLGTANELTGNNQRALELLQKAVSLNPASHFGSEWIHINILKAKIKDNSYERNLAGVNAEPYNYKEWLSKPVPVATLDSLITAVAYQLHERIYFVKAPDKYVGRLICDFADLVAKRYSMQEAIPFFIKAVSYDKDLEPEIQQRINALKDDKNKSGQQAAAAKDTTNGNWWIYCLLFLGGAVISTVFFKLYKNQGGSLS